jgi:hypothetical protein
MKNIKKFENFDNFSADEEADQMKNDQIYSDNDDQDAQEFGGEESQEEEGLEIDEVVNRVLAAIEECGDDCEEDELRSKITAVLTDFHHAQESQEDEEDDNYENDDDEGHDDYKDLSMHNPYYSEDDSEKVETHQEGVKSFKNFKR